MTTPMLKNVGDEFAEEFAEEYYKIFAMAMTVERLLSPPEDSIRSTSTISERASSSRRIWRISS